VSPAPSPPRAADLRRRRRIRTKLQVQAEALALFQGRGYQQTSVEDIAHAAAISPRTFYRYFACKEDVVLWDEFDDVPPAQVWDVRPGEDAFAVTVRRLREMTGELLSGDRERLLLRATLSYQVPEVRSRFVMRMFELLGAYLSPLASTVGTPSEDFRVAVPMAAAFSAMLVAVERWQRDGGTDDLLRLIDEAIAALPGLPAPA
jgi:AcrR family transcriptional regulator